MRISSTYSMFINTSVSVTLFLTLYTESWNKGIHNNYWTETKPWHEKTSSYPFVMFSQILVETYHKCSKFMLLHMLFIEDCPSNLKATYVYLSNLIIHGYVIIWTFKNLSTSKTPKFADLRTLYEISNLDSDISISKMWTCGSIYPFLRIQLLGKHFVNDYFPE